MLTVDRYINIHKGLKYTEIMMGGKGLWVILLPWIFFFCHGSMIFSVTDLHKNHVCTYVFVTIKVSLCIFLTYFTSKLKLTEQTYTFNIVYLSTIYL